MYIPVSEGEEDVPQEVLEILQREGPLVQTREVPSPGPLGQAFTRQLARDYRARLVAPGVDESALEVLGRIEARKIDAPKLTSWTVDVNVYRDDAAAKIGILSKLFQGEAKGVRAGVVHEAKRYTQEQAGDRKAEIGVAVRLAAATTQWEAKAELSLPTLAAETQMGRTSARITIEVLGYSGPLGTLLPSAQQLNVDTVGKYLEAFQQLQAQVFGEEGLAYLEPTLLGYTTTSKEEPPSPR